MMIERKALEIKDITETGEVAAVVATLEVWDKDGDWTEPGYFGTQHANILSAHNWGDIQLGKGVVSDESGTVAAFEGRFNLELPEAQALHAKLRFDRQHPPPLIEWSYGMMFHEGGTSKGTRANREGRILQPLPDGSPGARIPEVSPVVVGAGEGTGTTGVKAMQLIDHITATRSDVQALTERITEVVALRGGKGLGKASKAALSDLAATLNQIAGTLEPDEPTEAAAVLEEPSPPMITVDDLLILAQTQERLRSNT